MRALGVSAGLPSAAVADITDWLLTKEERDNDATHLDDGGSWSEGNLAGRSSTA